MLYYVHEFVYRCLLFENIAFEIRAAVRKKMLYVDTLPRPCITG